MYYVVIDNTNLHISNFYDSIFLFSLQEIWQILSNGYTYNKISKIKKAKPEISGGHSLRIIVLYLLNSALRYTKITHKKTLWEIDTEQFVCHTLFYFIFMSNNQGNSKTIHQNTNFIVNSQDIQNVSTT